MGTNEWNDDLTFSIAMNPYIDAIYKSILPVEHITRLTREDSPHILDKNFAIDTIIQLTNGTIFTAQEKIRRNKYLPYQDFTLEYQSNKFGAVGEYTKLCTDLYFYGYGDPDTGISCCYIFKPTDIKYAIATGELKGQLKTNKYHSTATFFAYPFKDFKDNWFIYKRPFSFVSGYGDTTHKTVSL